MATPTYPSWNDKEYDLLKKMTANTALIADYEIGDVASVAGTANQVLVNGGTAAATGNITLSLPSLISGISRISTTGTTTGATDLLINPTTKASGNLIDAQVNSVSKFSVTSAGAGTFADNLIISTTAKGLVWGSSISSITGNTTTGVLTVSQPGNTAFTISNGAMTGTNAMFELKTPSADVPIAMRFTPASSKYAWQIAAQTNVSNALEITPSTAAGGTTFSTPALTVGLTSTTVAGNLTVSGTSGVTATDLTLGTSGPSVKSSLSARAPRQGLVFDGGGSSYATGSQATSFGTGDFTIVAWVKGNPLSDDVQIVSGNASNSPSLQLKANGRIRAVNTGVAQLVVSTSSYATAGKWSMIYWKRSGTTNTIGNESSSETFIDSTNWVAPVGTIIGGAYFNGTIVPLVYNRALSAAEVVALYEAGAPSGADYNSASNTSVVTTNLFNAGSTYICPNAWNTFTGASPTGFTGTSTGNSEAATPAFSVKAGSTYLVKLSLTIRAGSVRIFPYNITNSGGGSQTNPVAGSNSFVFTAGITSSSARIVIASALSGNTDVDVSGFSVTNLGLLLAPDAAQAGGGLVWYDTSGNAANISWTSGVSWNVPSSRVLGGNWTTSGNLTVSGTGTSAFSSQQITQTNNGNQYVSLVVSNSTAGSSARTGLELNGDVSGGSLSYFNGSFGGSNDAAPYTTRLSGGGDGGIAFRASATNATIRFYTGSTEQCRLAYNGNLIIGSPFTDGGQKLQVNGTGYFSGLLSIAGGSGVYIGGTSDAGLGGSVYQDAGSPFATHINGYSLEFGTGGNYARTTRLTISNAGDATFAGSVTATSQGSGTNAGQNTLFVFANTSGTPVAGYGAVIRLGSKGIDGGAAGVGAEILTSLTGSTGASQYNSDLILKTRNGGSLLTALTLDTSQNATFAGKITANGAGSTFKGTATNDSAAAGYVGEYVSSTVLAASAVSMTTGTATNITSISLTAGDWDVSGLIGYAFTGTTSTAIIAGSNSTSATYGTEVTFFQQSISTTTTNTDQQITIPTRRYSLSATTTVYLIASCDFSAGTVGGYGIIQARRVR